MRPREYLSVREVDLLIKAAGKSGRHRHRDATLILVIYRHGFRVSEVVALQWDMVDLSHGRLHVNRLNDGIPSV